MWGRAVASHEVWTAADLGSLDALQKLLATDGNSVSATNSDGETALHVAARLGRLDCLEARFTSACVYVLFEEEKEKLVCR